jgi:hypothetical protein
MGQEVNARQSGLRRAGGLTAALAAAGPAGPGVRGRRRVEHSSTSDSSGSSTSDKSMPMDISIGELPAMAGGLAGTRAVLVGGVWTPAGAA